MNAIYKELELTPEQGVVIFLNKTYALRMLEKENSQIDVLVKRFIESGSEVNEYKDSNSMGVN